ncbi:MAG: redoxin domain-containing protein [Fidelibacterota bacterium]
MKVLTLLTLFVSIMFSQSYELGSKISLDHQYVEIKACANDSGYTLLSQYNGEINGGEYHIIWLNFFTTWCTNCQNEIPLVSDLNNQFNEQGLTLLSLGRQWDYPYSCQEWGDLGLSTPILDDDTTSIWNWFGLGYVPQQVILDHTMTVRYNDFGFDAAEIAFTIQSLLNEIPTVAIEGESPLRSFEILPPFPNPFNIQMVWNLNLKRETFVEANIIDLSGKIVSSIFNKTLPAGSHHFTYSGNDLSSGIYFLDVSTPFYRKTHKIVLLK